MNITGIEEAHKAVLANMTPRARELDRLERYVDGEQYAGRPSFWDRTVPLQERAPCIRYKIVAAAIASNVDLVLGEGRYPEASTHPDENDASFDESGLDEKSSEVLDRGLLELQRQTRLRSVAKETLTQAQGCGTAVAICGVRAGGRLFVDTVRAKWCERVADVDGRVTRLVIQYPYTVTEKQPDGSWKIRTKLFRREIDAERDVTMLPADASEDGRAQIDWKPDPAQTVEHGLGFCPVVWYAHLRGCAAVDEVDGKAIHALCTSEIEAHDFAISMRHRAALYAGDPQLCEFGVEPGFNPGQGGRTPGIPSTASGGAVGKPGTANEATGRYVVPTQGARKKGVSEAWQYPDKESRAEYLILPPDALKALDDDAHDLRQKLAEALSVVFLDPENAKLVATLSGKSIEMLRERQLNRCDQIRDDFGDGFLLPVLCVLLRIVYVTTTAGGALRLPGAKKLATILGRFAGEAPPPADGDAEPVAPAPAATWTDPYITLKWGAYFKADAEAEGKIVDAVVKAKAANVITRRMAVEKLKPVFNIGNVDQAVKALEKEIEEHASLEAAIDAMKTGDADGDEAAA